MEDKDYALMRKLSKELPLVTGFFTKSTGLKIDAPKVELSQEDNDVEWYSADRDGSTIFINPDYMRRGERLSYKALLAHGFFHHAQHSLFRVNKDAKLSQSLLKSVKQKASPDLLNNFVESGAMFFAVAYITKESNAKERKRRIISLLNSKAYTPHKGEFFSGNALVLKAYAKNGYSVKRTLKQLLSHEGAYSMLRDFLQG